METLYPISYGTRYVTMAVLRATHEPHMHPEYARRIFAFIEQQNGRFGIGGGYRPAGSQPNKPGFAQEGKSFHQKQKFPSGDFYTALDMVVANPGDVHRSPKWNEVPREGSALAEAYGVHMNVDSESWHNQPSELDGWANWVNRGRFDLQYGRPIIGITPPPPPVQPPTPDPTTQPPAQGVIVEFKSRNLAEGAVGNDVKFFQRILNDIASQGLLLDGHYGAKTTVAVRNWQTVFGLHVDGQLGPKTQASLIEIALTV